MIPRTPGPIAPDGFPTLVGTIDGKPVHWMISNPATANEWEIRCNRASPLLQLLIKKGLTMEGLTPAETADAERLIRVAPKTANYCKNHTGRLAIGDTRLCRECSLAVLGKE